MKFVNLTPHTINVIVGGETISFEPSGRVARVTSSQMLDSKIDGIPVYVQVPGDVEGIDLADNEIGIVSAMVLSALGHPDNLVAPNTSRAIRNEQGHIIGVPGFVR